METEEHPPEQPQLRPELDALPERLKSLPVHRGYPVPWFVAWRADGEPEFRAMDGRKWREAVQHRLCWVCGQRLGKYLTFAIGPMCGINRVTSEPPCHLECAQWSASNCPFLSKPQMRRRDDDEYKAEIRKPAGIHIERNPGVMLLWTTKTYEPFRVRADGPSAAGWLLRVGDPESVEFWRERRPATFAEVMESIESGYPSLIAMALADPEPDVAALAVAESRAEFDALLERHFGTAVPPMPPWEEQDSGNR